MPTVTTRQATAATEPYHWSQDLLASIVVFLVALPLCMGIALAAGVPVAAGLITGIVGGLVTASIAGCPLQVSGPAAGLTVIVFEIVERLGLEMLGLAVLVAGGVQIAAGSLRLGQWFRAVSPAVIQGMLAGIGVLIFASQFHVMVDDKPRKSGIENLLSIPEAVWKGVGVPQIASAPERAFRTQALQEIGALAHRQVILRTQVAELVPFHEHIDETPELKQVVVDDLAPLVEGQRRISTELSQLGARIVDVEREVGESGPLHRAHEAIVGAQEQSVAAEKALGEGRAVDAVETQAAAVASIEAVSKQLKNHRLAASLGILTIVVILLWQKLARGQFKLIPGPLIAVSLATAIAAACSLPVLHADVPGSLIDEIHLPTRTLLATAPWREILQAGLLIAVVASAETLLSAAAVEQLNPIYRTNYDRELISQGMGNAICGVLGALPMTGVIVRSSANIQAGARSRLSAMLHGAWLLLFVVAFAWLLALIPTASLAAVLVVTGYKLIDLKSIAKLKAFGWGEVVVYAATLGTIVVEDLLTGVVVGVALAAGKLLYTFSHLRIRVVHDESQPRTTLHLAGAATFMRLPQLAAALEESSANEELHVDLLGLSYIDHACLELLTNWAAQHEATGGELVMDWDRLHATFHGAHAHRAEAEHEAA